MKEKKPFQVLFLCTGNICRSPMAEGLLRFSLDPKHAAVTRVLSAGVAGGPGIPASEHAVTVCSEIGVDIENHRSQPLTPDLIESTDLLLAMEYHHLIAARTASPQNASKMHLLSHYAAGSESGPPMGVADPIGGDLDEYRGSRAVIEQYINQALPRIEAAVEASAVES